MDFGGGWGAVFLILQYHLKYNCKLQKSVVLFIPIVINSENRQNWDSKKELNVYYFCTQYANICNRIKISGQTVPFSFYVL